MMAARTAFVRNAARIARMRTHLRPRDSSPGQGRQKSCRLGGEEGAGLVETALSLGILLTFVLGLMQMSLALYSYHSVSQLAREATRYAIVRGSACVGLKGCGASNDTILSYLQTLGYPAINAANLSTTTIWNTAKIDTSVNTLALTYCSTNIPLPGCNDPGDQVQVQVTYNYTLNIPFVPSAKLTLSSTSAMMISQ